MIEGCAAPCRQLNWDKISITSGGWSGSITVTKHSKTVFFEQIRPPSKWSNEIHIIFPGSWRQTQVAAYLDDGTFYSNYGTRINSAPVVPWRAIGSKVGVHLEIDSQKNSAIITFYRERDLVFSLPITVQPPHRASDLLIELRVHPDGALKLLL
jgi:hypothetical protein